MPSSPAARSHLQSCPSKVRGFSCTAFPPPASHHSQLFTPGLASPSNSLTFLKHRERKAVPRRPVTPLPLPLPPPLPPLPDTRFSRFATDKAGFCHPTDAASYKDLADKPPLLLAHATSSTPSAGAAESFHRDASPSRPPVQVHRHPLPLRHHVTILLTATANVAVDIAARYPASATAVFAAFQAHHHDSGGRCCLCCPLTLLSMQWRLCCVILPWMARIFHVAIMFCFLEGLVSCCCFALLLHLIFSRLCLHHDEVFQAALRRVVLSEVLMRRVFLQRNEKFPSHSQLLHSTVLFDSRTNSDTRTKFTQRTGTRKSGHIFTIFTARHFLQITNQILHASHAQDAVGGKRFKQISNSRNSMTKI